MYCPQNVFRQACTQLNMATENEPNQYRELLNSLFNEIDLDGNGFLDEFEFKSALTRLHLPMISPAEWHELAHGSYVFDSIIIYL